LRVVKAGREDQQRYAVKSVGSGADHRLLLLDTFVAESWYAHVTRDLAGSAANQTAIGQAVFMTRGSVSRGRAISTVRSPT
jgi:hypothetical protein